MQMKPNILLMSSIKVKRVSTKHENAKRCEVYLFAESTEQALTSTLSRNGRTM